MGGKWAAAAHPALAEASTGGEVKDVRARFELCEPRTYGEGRRSSTRRLREEPKPVMKVNDLSCRWFKQNLAPDHHRCTRPWQSTAARMSQHQTPLQRFSFNRKLLKPKPPPDVVRLHEALWRRNPLLRCSQAYLSCRNCGHHCRQYRKPTMAKRRTSEPSYDPRTTRSQPKCPSQSPSSPLASSHSRLSRGVVAAETSNGGRITMVAGEFTITGPGQA